MIIREKSDLYFLEQIIGHGDPMAHAISHSPLTAGLPISHLGHSIWVSWSTKRVWVRFSRDFLYHKFHPTISPHSTYSSGLIYFSPVAVIVRHRRDLPASLLFTDLQFRSFIASRTSSRPCVKTRAEIQIK